MGKKLPTNYSTWIKGLVISGAIFSIMLFVFQAIAEDEIQSYWNNIVRPFLFSKTEISWGTIIIVIIAIIFIAYYLLFLANKTDDRNPDTFSDITEIAMRRKSITKMDFFSAISLHREGQISDIDLAVVTMYAVNNKVITVKGSEDSLISTPYTLRRYQDEYIFTLKNPEWR